MPWGTIQDEFGKLKWIDHEGRVYQGAPYAVEPDATPRTAFIASMVHAYMQHPVLNEKPDVTCPFDAQDSERRKIVHHEEVPGQPKSKKNNSNDKKLTFMVKTKSIPVTPKTVAASIGSERERHGYCPSTKRLRISFRTW